MARGRSFQKRKVKVSRKTKNQLRTKIKNEEVQSEWGRGSLATNYAQLGLATDPNAVVQAATATASKKRAREVTDAPAKTAAKTKAVAKSGTSATAPKKPKLLENWSKIDQEEALHNHGTNAVRRPAFWVSEEDCLYIKPLVDKHGSDIAAMARDLKLNPFQRTKGWLKRFVTKYNLFMQDQSDAEATK